MGWMSSPGEEQWNEVTHGGEQLIRSGLDEYQLIVKVLWWSRSSGCGFPPLLVRFAQL